MKQTIVPMKVDAKLIVRTSADLFIEAGDQPQLMATVDDGDSFRMKDNNGIIYLQANSDTKLVLPATASLVLERVSGDASILGMQGKVEVQKVGGDLHFQGLSNISVDSVGGDCVFKEITGPVDIKRVGGDLDGFKVGDISIYGAGGDVELSSVQGKVQITSGGDVHLQLSGETIRETHVRAGGEIDLVVLENAVAILELNSQGEEISVHACGQHLDVEEEHYSLPLGKGGEVVELNAGGAINVREGKDAMGEFSFVFEDLGDSWRDFGREIEEKIRHSMKGVNHQLRHAGWEASNAMRHAAGHLDQFTQRPGPDGKVYGFGFGPDEESPAPKQKKAASDEERMLVLRMLQDKKISVEEAEKLLQALEG
ncbi:MAG: hypothetical protein AB9897_01395 [Anaerolineaceae bacterium]